ncbi:hypothetical protein CCACVL1_20982 [Corchorus capsularis]|uniref:Uncharacterized protein n=1 Tax=Corchorus capsularis TaxID=210143 RepID=A0A1R3H990_COCAP|nr:hypothetical protein CCACVL1_20982 [Corchorus capsularis]
MAWLNMSDAMADGHKKEKYMKVEADGLQALNLMQLRLRASQRKARPIASMNLSRFQKENLQLK